MADKLEPLKAWDIDSPGPHYPGCPLLMATTVLLNGEPMELVRGWDCEAGTVRRIAKDENGIKLNDDRSAALEETLYGEVAILIDEGVGQSL